MEKRLERDESDKMLAGVAAGLAEYLNVEVVWIRVLFVCLTIFGFAGVWIYIILWIAVPAKPYNPDFPNYSTDYRVYEEKRSDYQTGSSETIPPFVKKRRDNSAQKIAGLMLIVLGIYFLFDEFVGLPEWISLAKLWPLVFVAIGLVILIKSEKKKEMPDFTAKKETPNSDNEKPEQPSGDEPLNK